MILILSFEITTTQIGKLKLQNEIETRNGIYVDLFQIFRLSTYLATGQTSKEVRLGTPSKRSMTHSSTCQN
jgi:hypothetical protein